MQDFLDQEPIHKGRQRALSQLSGQLAVVEEPICVLRVELDGSNVEEIKLFEGDDPEQVVSDFSKRFFLSR